MTERRLTYARARLDGTPPKDGPLTFTASSTALNRHGFSLRTEGWRLDNYNANPVVLWMHDAWEPPIGQGVAMNKGDRILAEVTFDQSDEFARTIESKYRRGFMNAVSVGLDFVDEAGAALNAWRMTPEQIHDEAFYDMAELSAVTVPADPGALIENSRAALSRLSRRLVDIVDEQERGTALAAEIQAAVRAELTRLGIDPEHLASAGKKEDPPAEPAGLTTEQRAALLAAFKEGIPGA